MSAGNYTMNADQGATFTRVVTWRDASNALVNLTGYTARMQVRPTVDNTDVTPTLSLTTENGRITLGGALGTITLTIPFSAMTMDEGQYVYDLEMISPSGAVVTRLLQGAFIVSGQVTK